MDTGVSHLNQYQPSHDQPWIKPQSPLLSHFLRLSLRVLENLSQTSPLGLCFPSSPILAQKPAQELRNLK